MENRYIKNYLLKFNYYNYKKIFFVLFLGINLNILSKAVRLTEKDISKNLILKNEKFEDIVVLKNFSKVLEYNQERNSKFNKQSSIIFFFLNVKLF